MLEAIPKSIFSWNFFLKDDGNVLAEIDLSLWREKGTLLIQGTSYYFFGEGWMSGLYILKSREGSVIACADKPSAFLRRFEIQYQSQHYTLRAISPLHRRFDLCDSANRTLGSITPQGIFTRRADVDLPDALPLSVKAFTVSLVIILWRRQARSNSSSSSGSQ